MGKRSWVYQVAGIYGPSENSSLAGAMREKAEPPTALLTPCLHPYIGLPGVRGGPQTSPTGICPNCQILSTNQEAHAITSYSEAWFFVTDCSVVRAICISAAITSWPGLKWSTLV